MVEELLQPDPHAHHEIGRCFLHFVRNHAITSPHLIPPLSCTLLKVLLPPLIITSQSCLRSYCVTCIDGSSARNRPLLTGACNLEEFFYHFYYRSSDALRSLSTPENDQIRHMLSIYLSGLSMMRQCTCVICSIGLWYTALCCYISRFFDAEPRGTLAYNRFQSLINLTILLLGCRQLLSQ